MFREVAKKRYLIPIQELIYKRLADYFSGFMAKSMNADLCIRNDEKNDSGKFHLPLWKSVLTCIWLIKSDEYPIVL